MESQGKYPTRSRTPVADVARYQNDGTEKIPPSKFIERAEDAADGWSDEMDQSQFEYLETGDEAVLQKAADQIASDISQKCDRVKTGILKRSFVGKVEHGRS